MAKCLASDINAKSVYLKIINKARGELNILTNKLNRTLKAKDDCYNYLLARKGNILESYKINLDNYKIEFIDKQYNENKALETIVLKYLRHPIDGANRQDIIQLAKWCSILKNEPILNKKLLLCKTKYNMNFTEYRDLLSKYYMKVHEILLNGDAYKFGNGIGTLYLKTINLSKTRFHIDFKKTKEAKEKLISEGKTPYRKEDAVYAAENGLQYDGVQYLVEDTKNKEVVFIFTNSKYFTSRRKMEFKASDYVNLRFRGMTYDEIIKNFELKEQDVPSLQLSIKRKLHIMERINPGIFYRFEREK